MARSIGEVLDAYFEPWPRATASLNLLVPLERDAWIASAVAVRLVEAVSSPGAGTALTAADPLALTLVGSVCPRARTGLVRVNAWFATAPASVRPDCVLSVETISGGRSRWAASAHQDATAPAAAIGLVEAGTDSAGIANWLATISERDALRVALGASHCKGLDRATLAVEGWLQSLSGPA